MASIKTHFTEHSPWEEVSLTSCLTGLDLTKHVKTVVHSTKAKQVNPNKISRRSDVQLYFPLRSKLVFSASDANPHQKIVPNCVQ